MAEGVNDMLTAEGVAAIVDFQHHPFGNAYFPTKECGGTVGSYDSDVRHCWAKACIGVASPPTDCFSATVPVSQHNLFQKGQMQMKQTRSLPPPPCVILPSAQARRCLTCRAR